MRIRTLLEPGYTAPPAPRSFDRNVFLPDNLSYQDVQQKPVFLTVAYARSLQYWADKQSPPRHWSLHPLAKSVIELWEVVKEYVTFNHQDIIRGLGTDEEPQATIFSWVLSSTSENSDVGRTATNTAGTFAERDTIECAALSARTKMENPCLLFATASVTQLNLGPSVNTTVGNVFWNSQIVATFSVPSRVVCYGDTIVKELDK